MGRWNFVEKMSISLEAATEMEGEEVWKRLPGVLVEKILAMVPFPYIFKARCLSKLWLARLSPISSQEGEEEKWLAISFQKQVAEWSHGWETFCPLFLNRVPNLDSSIAYNVASQTWWEMPSPIDTHRPWRRQRFAIEGALLYGLVGADRRRKKLGTSDNVTKMHSEIVVANLLTRTWKQLPSCFYPIYSRHFTLNLVIDESLQTYKVILFSRVIVDEHDEEIKHFNVQIYDAKSDSCVSKTTVLTTTATYDFYPVAEYFDGILYIADSGSEFEDQQSLLAVSIEDGTVLEEFRLSSDDQIVAKMDVVKLVVCNGNLVLIGTLTNSYREKNGRLETYSSMLLLKIDFRSLRLLEMACAPSTPSTFTCNVACSGNCIFILYESGLVMTYSADEDKWSSFPVPAAITNDGDFRFMSSPFQPGLSAFLEV